jgi:tRNA (guanine6-N2)-methyltransferase
MSRSGRSAEETGPIALYAMVQGGLESIAAEEITRELGGTVKKTSRGLIVFSLEEVTPKVLELRTVEDVFLLAWGSDSLTYRLPDLDNFRKWTSNKPNWPAMFKIHHALRPKTKGKPTFHIVTQLQGEHGYRRVDARQSLSAGLARHIPASWHPTDENAWLEIWLTVRSKTAVCGLRLSDRTMRHRTYKDDHILASLRPSVAGGMVRLAGVGPGMLVVDPMCGAGTIVAETLEVALRRKGPRVEVVGGDIDPNAVFVSSQNLVKVGPAHLARWDSRRLPLGNNTVDRIISNPPFGKQLASPDEIPPLYAACAAEWNRVLKPGGRAVFIVMEQDALKLPLMSHHWRPMRQYKVRLLGQLAMISVWQKPE